MDLGDAGSNQLAQTQSLECWRESAPNIWCISTILLFVLSLGSAQRWIIIFLLQQISRLLAPAKGCSLLIPFFIRDSVSGDQWNVSSIILYRNLKRLAANDSVTSPSRQTLNDVTLPTPCGLGDDDEHDEQQNHDISGYPSIKRKPQELCQQGSQTACLNLREDMLYIML